MILSNPNFGTLVTESGGGYTWFGNSRQFKLTQWVNDPVCDPVSEQLWIRDEDTYEVFQAMRDCERVRYTPGAVTLECSRQSLSCSISIWVDLSEPIKYVQIKLGNKSDRRRNLSATYFADVVLGDHIERTHNTLCGGILKEQSAVWVRNPYHEDYPGVTFVLMSSQIDSLLSANRSMFEQSGSSPGLPLAMCVEKLDESDGLAGETGAAVRSFVQIEPQNTVTLTFALAVVDDLSSIEQLQHRIREVTTSDQAFKNCLTNWSTATQPFVVQTPNYALDRLVNDWLLYQTIACRIYARTAYYQCGGAFGFRDQLQDGMAAVYSDPALVRQQLLKSASRQFVAGDVQHWWHEPSGNGTRTRFSDDRLFLPYTALHYVRITGDESIWDERVHFIDSAPLQDSEQERYEHPKTTSKSASFFDHCMLAIDVSLKFGSHGLPLMGSGDWNDGMNRIGEQGKGESIWVAWFLLSVVDCFAKHHQSRLAPDKYAAYLQTAKKLRVAVDEHAWDGDWYLRAFFDDGTPLGSHRNQACRIDSLTQSWAVFVNPTNPRTKHAFVEAVNQLVDHDAKMIRLFAPSFDRYEPDPGYINAYLPGIRENGGQYTHAAIWLAQAAALIGETNLAMQLFDYLNPLLRSNSPSTALKYKLEPYVMPADIYYNPQHVGRGGWSWYTGSAAWMYRLAIETILGVQLRGQTIAFTPKVPDDWRHFSVKVNLPDNQFVAELVRGSAGESDPQQAATEFRAGQVIALNSIENGQTIRIRF
jgi:cyclic beta-1,2-glucan synthetase